MEDINTSTDATATATPAEPKPIGTPSKHQSPIDQAMDAAKRSWPRLPAAQRKPPSTRSPLRW